MAVFYPIYFAASSYPIFVFEKNNHGYLGVIQSLQYKNLSKAVLRQRHREIETLIDLSREKQRYRPERKSTII